MPSRRKLILFVEGEGDQAAAPILVNKIITELDGWDVLQANEAPFKVGAVADKLTKDGGKNWQNWLGRAKQKANLGAVLLLLDGDAKSIRNEAFCPATFAIRMAEWSRVVGGGTLFSVSCVFALQEFESWFIACANELAGKKFLDGRDGLSDDARTPIDTPEVHPRDAKKWLRERMVSGYKETTDQKMFTELMLDHLHVPRGKMHSFRRLERAIHRLIEANRSGQHIVDPVAK